MSFGRLLIAALLLAGLSAGVWYANKREATATGKPAADAPPKILALSEDSIKQIEIKRRNGDDTVVKKSDGGKWEITAPKPLAADQSSVGSLTSAVVSL